MTPHLLILGPSGVGKSTVTARAARRGFLPIEIDAASRTSARRMPFAARINVALKRRSFVLPPEYDGMVIENLMEEWTSFEDGDARPLSSALRVRSDQADAEACIVSFPSGVVLSAGSIVVAEAAGIAVRILYGSVAECLGAFLARETSSGRGLGPDYWFANNARTHRSQGRPEFAAWRVTAFGEDGSRRPLDDLVDEICFTSAS